ncbi:hypothetical protein IEQ34_022681 [Dendrobium chrysotoxum]|uniref:Uncharacterized protein n=1 Tax=Dendrobium chrysotoxum TaxID=161865 RepID=A0AAV7FYJ6_DENCH|nr:hypothetical protein IEQ34_022681 [Dendrobium chrysotoxum]
MENTGQVNNQRGDSDLSFGRRISKSSDNLSGGELRVTPSSAEIKKRDKASKVYIYIYIFPNFCLTNYFLPLQDGDRRRPHGANDDVASTITSDGLAVIRRKFHIPNEVLIIAPKRSD